MTKHFAHIVLKVLPIVAIATLALAVSCITNDVPYPRIQPNFLTFEVEGQQNSSTIDSLSRTVSFTLDESTDIYNVQVKSYTLSPGATLVDNTLNGPIDMSSPVNVTLRLYQDYSWKLQASQEIERYFEVEGQMGTTLIDVPGRRIVVKVRRDINLSTLRVIRAKLANVGSTIYPDIANGGTINAQRPATLRVEVFGHSQEWTLYVESVQEAVRTASADAWTNVLWIYGEGEAGADAGAQYRLQGDSEWIDVPESNISKNGGSFTARVDHVKAQSTYEVRAVSGANEGATLTVSTGSVMQLPNNDFEDWWLDGKIWCPWSESGSPFWGTGNKGATTLGSSNTFPTDDTPSGSGRAAQLETRFVGIATIGKLAAGNLFAGEYVRTDGTNGILSMGRPFTERPTRLTGMYKYIAANISHADNEHKNLIGQPDTGIVWVALIDSDEPLEIRTNPKDRQLFDENAPSVIAYGKMEQTQNINQWTPFQVELKYRSTSRVPKYILITSSASKYGDFFTGGAGATLFIDKYELEYDY